MLIDWFTVGFQIINFLILIALLKRFLFGPILRAMDERESTIAAHLFEAATAKNEAEARALLLAKDQEAFACSKDQMKLDAQQEINRLKKEGIDQIREEIAGTRTSWQQNLAEEQKEFLRKLKIHISRQVFQIGQKALADLADTSLESCLVKSFLEKVRHEPGIVVKESTGRLTATIEEMKALEQPELSSKLPRADRILDPACPQRRLKVPLGLPDFHIKDIQKPDTLLVTTGFPLEAPLKESLMEELGRSFSWSNGIDFNEDTTLGFGISLLAGDQKWEWNLSRYMCDIEEEIIKGMERMGR